MCVYKRLLTQVLLYPINLLAWEAAYPTTNLTGKKDRHDTMKLN